MRNGPSKGAEWVWLTEEIEHLEGVDHRMKDRSKKWLTRYKELVEWVESSNGTLTVKQKSQARARLGRMTWSKSGR